MTNKEAVNWLINLTADIGKSEHRDLWHYEQALSEIKELLEGKDINVPSNDTISRQDVIELVKNSYYNLAGRLKDTWEMVADVERLPSAQQKRTEERTKTHACDLIDRQAAIDAINKMKIYRPLDSDRYVISDCLDKIVDLPSAQSERKYTLEEVAEILASVIGDECACNINGIDEWLPERCKYAEIREECPNPKEKHGCWMQFLLQGGAKIREVNRMKLITLTRRTDGAKMYVNPEQICAVYPYYKIGTTVIQFAGAENNFIEVAESPDSIAAILQAQA